VSIVRYEYFGTSHIYSYIAPSFPERPYLPDPGSYELTDSPTAALRQSLASPYLSLLLYVRPYVPVHGRLEPYDSEFVQ